MVALDCDCAKQNLDANWSLYVDGSSTDHEAAAGVVLKNLDNTIIKKAIKLGFLISNNAAEYEAVIQGI